MDFLHPLVIALIVPLAWATYRTGRKRLGRLPWLRALVTLILRLLIGALLVIALAGPEVTRAAAGVNVVFVLDRSASVGAIGRHTEEAWVQAALQARHPDDTASLVSLGDAPAWSGEIAGKALPAIPDTGAGATDIEAALHLALAAIPPDRPTRLVLLSDGRQTQGDALQAAQQAAQAQVPISVVPIGAPATQDVAVTAVDLPQTARSGEHITLRITLHAGHAGQVRLRLSVDGTPLGERAISLQTGTNSFFFAQTAGAPGVHTYRVQVQAPGDTVPQNDTLDAAVVVGQAPRVLVLAGNVAEASALSSTLSGTGLHVTMLPAEHAPKDSAGLSNYDAVVLADVPASALAPSTIAALRTNVHDRGQGLLVTGGAHSFAVGGYPSSRLEDLLPVTSLAVAHAGRGAVGLVLVIDKSGSMMDEVHGVSKISMAQQAAIDAVAHLRPTDEFGVLAFDDSTHIVVPYQPVDAASQAHTRQAIMAVQPFGDTVIYPALRQAARYLFASHALFKHVVLLTDGQGETAPFLKLIKQMRQNNITLSTIAIGTDAEVDELRGFAVNGGGRFYYVADPHDIPRLVVLETRISSGPTRVQGTLGVRQGTNASVLRSLIGRTLPSLHAYNITAPRDTAQVVLQSQLGDPILSQWQYGLGRVTAWTGGTTQDWARAWLGERAFWSDTVHDVLAGSAPQALRPALHVANSMLHIGADATTPSGDFANLLPTRAVVRGPAGRNSSVTLVQDAPGHYSAAVPAPDPGAYTVTVAQYDGQALLHQAQAAVTAPYPPEYAPGAPDLALLTSIAAADNAPTLGRPADAFDASGLPTYPVHRAIWPLLALLALLLFPIDVAVRVLYTPPIPYDPARFDQSPRL